MTLVALLKQANNGYPDGWLVKYYHHKTGAEIEGDGDTLALFIVRELRETFDAKAGDKAQLEEAQRVMRGAIADLEGVLSALQ